MENRYSELTKIPQEPLSRLMARADMELSADVDVPAAADTEYVLRKLDAMEEWAEIIMVLATALPQREAVWWSCLAAQDYIKIYPKTPRNCVQVAEAWVFDPGDKTLADIEHVLENISPKDKTSLCATAALYGSGTMGTGDMANIPAPPSAVATSVFGMNMLTMAEAPEPERHVQWLIDRALDIARGGNGKVRRPDPIVDADDADDDEEEVDSIETEET